jgi:hypothetical protein
MSDSEFTYFDFEECSVFEENSEEDVFDVDQMVFASARAK